MLCPQARSPRWSGEELRRQFHFQVFTRLQGQGEVAGATSPRLSHRGYQLGRKRVRQAVSMLGHEAQDRKSRVRSSRGPARCGRACGRAWEPGAGPQAPQGAGVSHPRARSRGRGQGAVGVELGHQGIAQAPGVGAAVTGQPGIGRALHAQGGGLARLTELRAGETARGRGEARGLRLQVWTARVTFVCSWSSPSIPAGPRSPKVPRCPGNAARHGLIFVFFIWLKLSVQ